MRPSFVRESDNSGRTVQGFDPPKGTDSYESFARESVYSGRTVQGFDPTKGTDSYESFVQESITHNLKKKKHSVPNAS